MNIRAEGSEEFGNKSYEELFQRILMDLGLTNRVELAKMLIYPERHLFIVSIRTRQARTTVRVDEIADVGDREGSAYLVIRNESYAPALLALLWKQFGRERIEQLSRLEVLAHGIPPEKVQALILDPGDELRKSVLDAVWRLLPEGFKVRHDLFAENVITIISTEHDMLEEYLQDGIRAHQQMIEGVGLEEEEEEETEDQEEEDQTKAEAEEPGEGGEEDV
jgi:putative methanogenesis marker protein 17